MGDVFGSPFSRTYFERNNVFYFAQTDNVASLKRMKIYFNVGNNDDYGFEQGRRSSWTNYNFTRHSARVPHLPRWTRPAVRDTPLRGP